MTSSNEVPTPPEAIPKAPPEAVKPRFGRKLYLVIGLVAIAIIATASIVVFTQLLPGARGEPVPLGLNYSEGEKMTYEISMTAEVKAMGMEEETSQEGTLEMEVLSFDGENYTIYETMTLDTQEVSFTMKMNQMGYVVGDTELPPEFEETFSYFFGVPGFGSYFTEEEIRVGESWNIPFDIEFSGIDLEGTVSYKLSGITSITVDAGTYEALKIKVKTSGLSATIEGMDFTMNINGYVYLENATCRLIKLRLDASATMTGAGQSASIVMTMQMELIEHLK